MLNIKQNETNSIQIKLHLSSTFGLLDDQFLLAYSMHQVRPEFLSGKWYFNEQIRDTVHLSTSTRFSVDASPTKTFLRNASIPTLAHYYFNIQASAAATVPIAKMLIY